MLGFKYLSNSELETLEFPKQDQVLLKDGDTQVVSLFGAFVGPVSSGSGALTGYWCRGCDLVKDLCLGLHHFSCMHCWEDFGSSCLSSQLKSPQGCCTSGLMRYRLAVRWQRQ